MVTCEIVKFLCVMCDFVRLSLNSNNLHLGFGIESISQMFLLSNSLLWFYFHKTYVHVVFYLLWLIFYCSTEKKEITRNNYSKSTDIFTASAHFEHKCTFALNSSHSACFFPYTIYNCLFYFIVFTILSEFVNVPRILLFFSLSLFLWQNM